MDKDQIEAIKARRNEAYRWITTLQMTEERRRSESLLVSAERDVDALLEEVERLGALLADLRAERDALEAEASVYRVTVLAVNVAAGQGED